MTPETPPMLNSSEHADQHDQRNLISEFRRRQLDIFRQRELKTELDSPIRTTRKNSPTRRPEARPATHPPHQG